MEEQKEKNIHRPRHIYEMRFLFVSGRTYQGIKYFNIDDRKSIFKNKLASLSKKFGVGVYAWIILENHYHLMIRLPEETNLVGKPILSEFFRSLHSQIATIINIQDKQPGRKIWYQYWDYFIRNEKDFWKHFNYLLQNPLKHKLVINLRQVFIYPYSSNRHYLELWSEEGVFECLEKFPVRDWTPSYCD